MSNTNEQAENPQIISDGNSPIPRKKNRMGLTGFIFSIIALCFGWVPFLGWILLALGFIFSLIGVFRAPRKLAIAGLAISVFSFTAYTLYFTFEVMAGGGMCSMTDFINY
ncbi:MAG: hypothetical protein M0P38_02410 [Bacteroidales bacterium]|jgi:hypothetical protein|nr:hypothetical protein [Bacteroidales bacterium]